MFSLLPHFFCFFLLVFCIFFLFSSSAFAASSFPFDLPAMVFPEMVGLPNEAAQAMEQLPDSVKAAVISLPVADMEVFAYLVSHPVDEDDDTKSSKNKRKQAQLPVHRIDRKQPQKPASLPKKNVPHDPSFGCGCFECYRSYWRLWDVSSNRKIIHDAISLVEDIDREQQALEEMAMAENVVAVEKQRSSWAMGMGRGRGNTSKDKGKKRGTKDKAKKNKCSNSTIGAGHGSDKAQEQCINEKTELKMEPEKGTEALPDLENVPECEAAKEDEKGNEEKLEKKGLGQMVEKQKTELSGGKRKLKQVAPVDFKEEIVPSMQELAINRSLEEVRLPTQGSFGKRISETAGFVCEKLLGMWYPRLQRR